MNVIDVNLLVYAYDETAGLHHAAKAWLTQEFTSAGATGLAPAVLVSFVRITTNARILAQPFNISEACDIVNEWLRQPSVHVLTPTERHWNTFTVLATRSQAHGPLVPDADLAATAIEHGATLCTHDRDFTRFEGLRVVYPLQPSS